jgi:5-dehydro-4-deoxyglucarate dehydratase
MPRRDNIMSKLNPEEMATSIGEDLLAFPATHFDREHEFSEQPYRQHIACLLERLRCSISRSV